MTAKEMPSQFQIELHRSRLAAHTTAFTIALAGLVGVGYFGINGVVELFNGVFDRSINGPINVARGVFDMAFSYTTSVTIREANKRIDRRIKKTDQLMADEWPEDLRVR